MEDIKIERKMDIGELRSVCIRYGLYTCGTNDQYSDMFVNARQARTDEEFVQVAKDIWQHSDAKQVFDEHDGFSFGTLLWYVLNDCVHTYVTEI